MDPTLTALLTYFRPLAAQHRTWSGGEALLSPGVNLLGANAAYLEGEADWHEAKAWAQVERWLLVRARLDVGHNAGTPQAGVVGTLRVGTVRARSLGSPLQIEQVSRLHLPTWSGVLAEAHGQPEWAPAIARHLAARLERLRDYALLLAYAGAEPVGALLWQPAGAHLWGTLDEAVDAPLLAAAAELSGGDVLVSLPDSSPVNMVDEVGVRFERGL